jgi:antitoxin (DNA-binding transcriptional repressor) of toxin-antitoxin stability system
MAWWSGKRVALGILISKKACRRRTVSELALEDTPAVANAAHEAAGGQVVYITERGERVAAIVPAALAAELANLSPDELAELLEDFADAAVARAARASIASGEPVIPWGQVKAEAGL